MKLFLLTAVTIIAFAANSVINRAALLDGAIDPIGFSLLRLWFGVAVLGLFVVIRSGGQLPKPELNLFGVVGLIAYMLGFSLAYVSMDAGAGALILFGGVQVTMFIGAIFRGQKPTLFQYLGAGIAFAGLVYLLAPSGDATVPLAASAAMVLAAIGWGVYSLIGGQAKDPVVASATSFALSAILVLALWAVLPHPPMSWRGIGLAALSGAVTSGMFYPLWYWLLPQLKITTAAVAQLTVPAIAMGGGALFLSEDLTFQFMIASIVILGGIGLSIWAKETST